MIDIKTLDPTVFSEAADLIDEFGWSGGGIKTGLCVWVAVSDILAKREIGGLYSDTWINYVDFVTAWFNCKRIEDVYRLNDRQPATTGHLWATSNLRTMAECVTRSQQKPLALV